MNAFWRPKGSYYCVLFLVCQMTGAEDELPWSAFVRLRPTGSFRTSLASRKLTTHLPCSFWIRRRGLSSISSATARATPATSCCGFSRAHKLALSTCPLEAARATRVDVPSELTVVSSHQCCWSDDRDDGDEASCSNFVSFAVASGVYLLNKCLYALLAQQYDQAMSRGATSTARNVWQEEIW